MAHCPVCSATTQQAVAHVGGYTVHECPACLLRFSDPMQNPGAEWYEQSHLYTERRERQRRVSTSMIRRDWRYRMFLSQTLNPGGSLLEVGCGSGMFLRVASANGYKVTGIDTDPSAVRTAQELYGMADVQALSVEDLLSNPWERCFDIICLFDVLEHLEKPLDVLRGLGTMLTGGGYLVCTAPSHQRWPHWFAPEVDVPPHHLTLWTASALEKCFTGAGMEPVFVKPSPLLGENLLHQASLRWSALRRLDAIGMGLRAVGQFIVMPMLARVLSLNPKAGGFTLFGLARKSLDTSPGKHESRGQDSE